MGFWSGLSLIKLDSDLDKINLNDYADFIINSEFVKNVIDLDKEIEVKNGYISIGGIKDDFTNIIYKEEERNGNNRSFFPAFIGLKKGIIKHLHIDDDYLELSGVELSFRGQGYPIPSEVEGVIKTFYELPGFDIFIDSFSKKFPSNKKFEGILKNTELIERYATFPSSLNNWYWFLYANG